MLGSEVDQARCPTMSMDKELSAAELTSLKEIAKGIHQRPVPAEHAQRLRSLQLIYRILGDLRITKKGRSWVIASSHRG